MFENLYKRHRKGFSIIELGVVMVVIGLMFAMIASGLLSYLDIAKYKETDTNQAIVTKALELYKQKKGRLPCPAVPTKDIKSDSDYGDEVSGGCSTSVCPTDLICDEDVIIGTIPTATLGINNDTSLDGWDNKITYVVEKNQTELYCKSNGQSQKSILINDPNGNAIAEPFCYETTGSPLAYNTGSMPDSRLGSPAFLLISHGADGNGSWDKYGDRSTCPPSDGNDKENCDDDNEFYDSKNSYSTSTYFDDHLYWYHDKSYSVCPEGITGCLAWLDASDRCTIGLDSSNNVEYLQDKLARSECGSDPETGAAGVSARPSYNATTGYNGMPTITFDGDDYINLANIALDSDEFEFYIVARPTVDHGIDTQSNSVPASAPDRKYLLYPSGSPADDVGLSIGMNGVSVYEDTGNTYAIGVYDPPTDFGNLPLVIRVVYVSGIPTIYINGDYQHTGETTTATDIYLQLGKLGDASNGFEGDFFEFIAYAGNLESHEANRITAYLMNKWRVY